MTKPGQTTTTEFSRAEALDILAQCKLLRISLDVLEEKARERLKRPELRLIETKG